MANEQRHSTQLTDRLVARTFRFRSIEVWFWTMAMILVAALIVMGISIIHPALLVY